MIRFLSAILICTALSAPSKASAPDGDKLVRPSLIAGTTAIEAGKPFRVAVKLKIEPHWHIYWLYPGDSGQPPEIAWRLPDGFVAGELQWPTPRRFDLPGGIVNLGYENETTLIATITPPAKLSGDPVQIGADITWLVCDPGMCIPGSGAVALSLPVGTASPANVDKFAAAAAELPHLMVAEAVTEAGAEHTAGANATSSQGSKKYEATLEFGRAVDRPIREVEWFIAVPAGVSVANHGTTRSGTTVRLNAEIRVMVGNNAAADRIYSVVAVTDDSGVRKGFVHWLHAGGTPKDGGRGQSGK